METGLFLAKIWGLGMLLLGAGLYLNPNSLKQLAKASKDEGFIFITGVFSLVIGLLCVLTYNVWMWDWRGLVTLMGWAALLKGIMRITAPVYVAHMTHTIFEKKGVRLWLLLLVVIGVYLTWVGFTGG